jgi:hypothetical protein
MMTKKSRDVKCFSQNRLFFHLRCSLDHLQQCPYHNLQLQNADPTSTVPAPAAPPSRAAKCASTSLVLHSRGVSLPSSFQLLPPPPSPHPAQPVLLPRPGPPPPAPPRTPASLPERRPATLPVRRPSTAWRRKPGGARGRSPLWRVDPAGSRATTPHLRFLPRASATRIRGGVELRARSPGRTPELSVRKVVPTLTSNER